MTDMDLKQARAIARSVGATIEESDNVVPGTQKFTYKVRLGVCTIGDNGTREYMDFQSPTPADAAKNAVLETAKAAKTMMDQAKQVYVDSDLIFLK
jgi:hypothetical protein